MRLQILRQTSIAGQPARVGDVVEVSDWDSRLLIASGKAAPAPAIDPAPAEVEPEVQDLEPTTAHPRTRKPRTRTHGSS
jgi:hypothetical protein